VASRRRHGWGNFSPPPQRVPSSLSFTTFSFLVGLVVLTSVLLVLGQFPVFAGRSLFDPQKSKLLPLIFTSVFSHRFILVFPGRVPLTRLKCSSLFSPNNLPPFQASICTASRVKCLRCPSGAVCGGWGFPGFLSVGTPPLNLLPPMFSLALVSSGFGYMKYLLSVAQGLLYFFFPAPVQSLPSSLPPKYVDSFLCQQRKCVSIWMCDTLFSFTCMPPFSW